MNIKNIIEKVDSMKQEEDKVNQNIEDHLEEESDVDEEE